MAEAAVVVVTSSVVTGWSHLVTRCPMMQEMLAVKKSGTAAVSWVAEAQDEVLQIEGKHRLLLYPLPLSIAPQMSTST